MNNRGFVVPVIVILISVMAIGLVGAAWYYEANKGEETTNTNTQITNTITTVTNTNTAVNTNTDSVDTSDWQTYESDTFSLQFPSNWTLGTSTFKDENQNKIAELSPGIIKLSEIGSCKEQPLPIKPQTGEPVEALIQENITIDGLVGVKTVWYTITAGDTGSSWYPNRYCIQNDNIAFVMNFYEKELGTGDRDLFEDILATLQFTN